MGLLRSVTRSLAGIGGDLRGARRGLAADHAAQSHPASPPARTEPPATTPVPCEAGLSSTVLAPKRCTISCGIVVPTRGTRMRFFFASSTPLRIASGTSPALPSPAPTWPAPSPTTTTALKLKRRPPLTTLATRLIWTTRSSSVSFVGSILAKTWLLSVLEVEAGFAGRLGQRLDAPVVAETGPVEDDSLDAGRLRALRDERADRLRPLGLGVLRRAELLLERRGGGDGATGGVVDDLSVDLVQAAEDGQARPRGRPLDREADPGVALVARRGPGCGLGHGLVSLLL